MEEEILMHLATVKLRDEHIARQSQQIADNQHRLDISARRFNALAEIEQALFGDSTNHSAMTICDRIREIQSPAGHSRANRAIAAIRRRYGERLSRLCAQHDEENMEFLHYPAMYAEAMADLMQIECLLFECADGRQVNEIIAAIQKLKANQA